MIQRFLNHCRELVFNRLFLVAFASAALVLLAAGAAGAQSADKILKQATKAAGGEKALKRVTSWAAAGPVTRKSDGALGECIIIAGQPNLYSLDLNFGGLDQRTVFNGRSAWTRDSRQGVATLTGLASRDLQFESWYRIYRWLDYKKTRAKAAFVGRSTIDGVAVNSITITSAKNVIIRLYFGESSGLLVRDEVPAGGQLRTTDYSDYRPVDGVMEPFARRLSQNGEVYEIRLNGVGHNGRSELGYFEFPRLSNEPLPDIPTLLTQVTANEKHIEEMLDNYGYTETTLQREFGDNGALRVKESEVYELTFYQGNRIRRLISKNDRPLSASDQAEEDKRLEKFIRNLEKKESEKERKAQRASGTGTSDDDDDNQRLSISDILRASRLINPRREVFRGRPVIVFDFEPLPGYKPQKDYEKFFGKTAGVIWIDDSDRQVARLEATLVDSFKIGGGLLASLKKGATFVFEQQRVNDEIWLPTSVEVNLSAKVLLFKSINANQLTTFGNYQKFNTEVEKPLLNGPGKDPAPQP